jgi:outer membrane murein-binding lipoprotein Lpp
MPFTVEDFHDLVRLLEERPEWRGELRRLVLSEELLSLPEQVASLRATTDQRFQELAEKISKLTDQVSELTESQKRLEEEMKELATQVKTLAEIVRPLHSDMAEMKGRLLEIDYRTKGPAYFGRIIRRAHVLSQDELTALVGEAVDSGILSDEQADEIYQADVIVRGRRREDKAEVYLVVGVSWGVGLSDVERATRRAALLARTGVTAIPVVAGQRVTPEAGSLAQRSQTWQVTDGCVLPPEPSSVPSS